VPVPQPRFRPGTPPLTSGSLHGQKTSRMNHGWSVRWVHDVLRHELRLGVFPGNTLPSEDSLIKRYNVSRGAIRRVMDLMRSEGLVERLRGTGTFTLIPTSLNHGLNVSRDFALDVNDNGTRVAIFAQYAERHPSTDFIASQLDIPAGEKVLILETVTYLDGFPFSFRSAFHPLWLFTDERLPDDLVLNRSPYLLLEELLGERPGDTRLHVTAGIADESVHEVINIPVGQATLDTMRVIYAQDGRPVEYSVSRARADSILFEVLMDGQANGAGGA